MGVVDANIGSFQIIVLAPLISDSKKRSFASDRPGASQARRIYSCAYLYTDRAA